MPRFSDLPSLPKELRIPRWLAAVVALAIAGGLALGALTASDSAGLARRCLRAGFFGSAFGYLAVSLLDFWEHFRLEREATGRWLAMAVVPVGETVNHVLTTATVVALLLLARPPEGAPRDLALVLLPLLFLALGWRDELVYHRRRCAHREDIMHTTAHLAAGTMLCTFLSLKLVAWP